jgi:hypothetical protein
VPIKTFNQLLKMLQQDQKKKKKQNKTKLKTLFQAYMRIKISCWNRNLDRIEFSSWNQYVTQKLARYESQLRDEMSLPFK